MVEKSAFAAGWRWSLPAKVANLVECVHTNCVDILGFGGHPRGPQAHSEPLTVQCGNCKSFIADLINPKAGIGNCAIAGEGSRGLLYPFKYHGCGDFAERATHVVEWGSVQASIRLARLRQRE